MMRCFLCAALLLACASTARAQTVIEILDGYQFKALWNGDTVTVVLNGIKPFKVKKKKKPAIQEFDAEGAFLWKIMSPGYPVRFEFDKQEKDAQGRLLAYVFFTKGKMVNEMIVGAGMALPAETANSLKYRDQLRAAKASAQKRKLGNWYALSLKRR